MGEITIEQALVSIFQLMQYRGHAKMTGYNNKWFMVKVTFSRKDDLIMQVCEQVKEHSSDNDFIKYAEFAFNDDGIINPSNSEIWDYPFEKIHTVIKDVYCAMLEEERKQSEHKDNIERFLIRKILI